jgi:hypothetical protein
MLRGTLDEATIKSPQSMVLFEAADECPLESMSGVHRLYAESRLGSPPLLSRIPMVQPTHTGGGDEVSEYNDLPYFPRLNGSFFRCVFFESQMRPVLVVVVDVRADHAPKLALIDRDQVVQAIAP